MKEFLKSKLFVVLMRISQIILFILPLGVLMLIYKDEFFQEKTGYGLCGLAIIGIIVYILGLKKVIGKLPKIVYFIFIYLIFLSMSYLSDFLVQIGSAMLIGAVLSLPINIIIEAKETTGKVDLIERQKYKTKKKIEVEIND